MSFLVNEQKENLCTQEIKGDLFANTDSISLAHCVSEDLAMSKGIAVEFKKRFKGLDELKEQSKTIGQCAYLKRGNRYIFYLITKKLYMHKPTYLALENSLKDMLKLCTTLNVTHLAMPRIGCGLDKLDWDIVHRIIDEVFENTNIKIQIFKLP